MKRILLIMLATANLLTIVGCSSTDDTADNTDTTSANAVETTTAEEITVESLLGFDREDNEGKTFNILSTTNKSYEYDAPEVTGDVVNDAVYEKNAAVEEYLGIDFDVRIEDGAWNNREVFNNLIKSDVMSVGTFDLVSAVTVCTMSATMEGLFLEGKSLPHVQFDAPWWIADMYDRFSVGGKLYGFIGDASLSLYKDLTVIYFNKRIWNDMDAPNPYDLVRNNEWTLDKFIEIASGMTLDLNGDGEFDAENDQLTFLAEQVPLGTFQTSLMLDVVKVSEDSVPEYLGLSDKFISAYERLQTFINTPGAEIMSTIDDRSYKSMHTFANGNVATMCNFIYSTEYLRDMADDYGILPMPKYDENQEKYVSQLGTSTAMLFVPVTTDDVALTSKVMEAFAYYTAELVVPKYYEVALKEKYARDTDMAEMLDIIRSGAAFDFLFVYGAGCLKHAPNNYFRFYTTDETNLASSFAANEDAFSASLTDLSEAYAKLEN